MCTSIIAKHNELGKRLDFLKLNAHLIGKARPPNNYKNPDFVNNRNVSVLMGPVDVNKRSRERLID